MKLSLSRSAMIAVLQGPLGQAAVDEAAHAIAANVDAQAHDGPVDVVVETHDAKLSAAASVTIDHPGGMAMEAKHGYLARAATAAGYTLGRG